MRGARCLVAVVALALAGCGPKAAPPDQGLEDPAVQKMIEEGKMSNPGGPPMGQGRFRPDQKMVNPETGQEFKGPNESGGGGAPQ